MAAEVREGLVGRERLFAIVILFLGYQLGFSQNPVKPKKTISYTHVECLLLINYSHELSSGVNRYDTYEITRRNHEYLIEASVGNRELHPWAVPLAKDEIVKGKEANNAKQLTLSIPIKSDKYVSTKLSYSIGNTKYIVYKHIDYNCYDPRCGTKHGHTTFVTGETYFSPEFGILLSVDNSNMEFNILYRIKEKKVPYDLILKILKDRKTDDRIIQEFVRKTSVK